MLEGGDEEVCWKKQGVGKYLSDADGAWWASRSVGARRWAVGSGGDWTGGMRFREDRSVGGRSGPIRCEGIWSTEILAPLCSRPLEGRRDLAKEAADTRLFRGATKGRWLVAIGKSVGSGQIDGCTLVLPPLRFTGHA